MGDLGGKHLPKASVSLTSKEINNRNNLGWFWQMGLFVSCFPQLEG